MQAEVTVSAEVRVCLEVPGTARACDAGVV